ncbi:MAG TPA: DUF2079 domain-containing protein [Thermoplasmata archaeon]|nr:DUF2079 domain-containing protein [Thermoplasmata archaeon]
MRGWAIRIAGVRTEWWLATAIFAYFAASLALSLIRAGELETTTWDFGIYQQAIWSTSHGRPFYEAADYETGGFGTFLQVHGAYVLYLVVPVYRLLPYEGTLFVIQSAVVAAAAYPLYRLGGEVTGSARFGLVAAVMYLAWTPTLAGNLYDFHIEAFLPVEIFTFVLLWNRRRIGLGFIVAGIAFATMEITPVLLFFVGVFFLWPSWATFVRAVAFVRRSGVGTTPLRTLVGRARLELRLLPSVALLGLCVAAYYLGLLLRERYLSGLLGVPGFPSANSGYVIGGNFGELGLLAQNLTVDLPSKLIIWGLLLALLGFIPLLAPRALVLAVPWVVFTLLSANPNYVVIGWQYGFVEAAALLVAFVFGLKELAQRLDRPGGAAPTARSPEARAELIAPPARRSRWRADRSVRAGTLAGVGFLVLLAVNLAASPVNPNLHNLGFFGGGYRFSAPDPAGYSDAVELTGLIPPGSVVLASENLFPLVGNDLNAYSLFWQRNDVLILPFDAHHLPRFVLLSEDRTYAVPSWLAATLYNVSDYGVRGVAWSTPVGAVVLFEGQYLGPTSEYGPAPAPGGPILGPALDPQASGRLVGSGDPRFPTVVESLPGATGPVWSVDVGDLRAGDYTLTMGLRAGPQDPTRPPPEQGSALLVNANGFSQSVYFQSYLGYSPLNGSAWVSESISFAVPAPSLGVEIRGYLADPLVQFQISYLTLATVP